MDKQQINLLQLLIWKLERVKAIVPIIYGDSDARIATIETLMEEFEADLAEASTPQEKV